VSAAIAVRSGPRKVGQLLSGAAAKLAETITNRTAVPKDKADKNHDFIA
jgi:hypothetical protein